MSAAGLLLTPGAGGDPDHPALVAVARIVEERCQIPVRRFGFGSPARGGVGPAGADQAVARIRAGADAWAREIGVDPARLVLGGRSFGGRMCSVAVAEGQPAAGVVLLSYPLHPPGRAGELRVEHLPLVGAPVLAVTGDRDPYGSPAELRAGFAGFGGPWELALTPGGHVPDEADAVGLAVAGWLERLG